MTAGAAVLVGHALGRRPPAGAARIEEWRPLARAIAPAVSVVPVQLLARELAILRGREPGAYVRASKVTTRG